MFLLRTTRLAMALLVLGGVTAVAFAQQGLPPLSLDQIAPAKELPEELLKVPEGTKADLIAYVSKLKEYQPSRDTGREEQIAFARKVAPLLVEAGDKILSGKPTEEEATRGFDAKIGGLLQLKMLGNPGIDQKLERLPEQMKQLGFPKLEQTAKAVLLQLEATTLMREIQQASQQGPAQLEAATAKAIKRLDEAPITLALLPIVQRLGQICQVIEKPDLAVSLFTKYGKALSELPNENAKRAGATMLGSVNRWTSVGKPIELEGVLLDGTKLDWKKQFDGKVVLVTFWATWCGPCRQEMEHLMKIYPYYHPKGFEVLGVNLDEEESAAKEFVKENNIPWPTLLAEKTEGAAQNPNAVRYGVLAIPTVMLVDKDGKVMATDLQTPKVDEMLTKLFGPLPSEDEKEKDSAKKE